jgi:hypothetical protein
MNLQSTLKYTWLWMFGNVLTVVFIQGLTLVKQALCLLSPSPKPCVLSFYYLPWKYFLNSFLIPSLTYRLFRNRNNTVHTRGIVGRMTSQMCPLFRSVLLNFHRSVFIVVREQSVSSVLLNSLRLLVECGFCWRIFSVHLRVVFVLQYRMHCL